MIYSLVVDTNFVDILSFTLHFADLPLENLDEGRFKEQWMHAMFGINSDNMPDVIESMKMLCGDLLAMAMAGRRNYLV